MSRRSRKARRASRALGAVPPPHGAERTPLDDELARAGLGVVALPMLDTGLGREAGYANDAELVAADELRRAELSPDVRTMVEDIEQTIGRQLLGLPPAPPPTRILGYRATLELTVEGRPLDVTAALKIGPDDRSLIVDIEAISALVHEHRAAHPPPYRPQLLELGDDDPTQ